jgi:KUP system potassium uptake protein
MGVTQTDSSIPAADGAARVRRLDPALAVAALGVVFGDIGTSPLYTIKTCFTTADVEPTLENVLGILSLLVWLLAFVVCVKYVGNLMRVDHDGEGGILALLARASPSRSFGMPLRVGWLTIVVVAGAAMLFGDGIITPAISVISAVEGIGVATKAAQPIIVPVSVAILIALFLIQSRGTEKVGRVFGPVMIVWFIAIGASGLVAIVQAPQVLYALDPRHALRFITHHGVFGFLVFGAVVLAMTGVEALYADMSHFGRAPIAFAWYTLVFPTLILSYLGQGAILLADRTAFDNPFFSLTPGPLLIPMVVLATLATVIASQALISGAFTLTEQAINLNLWPRMTVLHTSKHQRGQVYVPAVNVVLGIACVALVVTFRSSDNLAAAFGLAVSATMLATSIAFYEVTSRLFKWKRIVVVPLVASFVVVVDGTFFLAGLPKIPQGAWVPLVISAFFMVTALTWLEGRRCVAKALLEHQMPLDQYRREAAVIGDGTSGTMVFLTGDQHGVPFLRGRHRWIRARAERELVVLLTLVRAARPYVDESERVRIEWVTGRLALVTANFGYMDRPSIAPIIAACGAAGLHLDSDTTPRRFSTPTPSYRGPANIRCRVGSEDILHFSRGTHVRSRMISVSMRHGASSWASKSRFDARPAARASKVWALPARTSRSSRTARLASLGEVCMHRFRATIEKGSAAPNSWCYVRVPAEIARALAGSRRVSGTIEAQAFDGALQSRGAGEKTLLVKRELRAALGLAPGHAVSVELAADTRLRTVDVPPELMAPLDAQPAAARAFAALAPSHQREYADWIAAAKRPETKAARVERALSMIIEKRHVK